MLQRKGCEYLCHRDIYLYIGKVITNLYVLCHYRVGIVDWSTKIKYFSIRVKHKMWKKMIGVNIFSMQCVAGNSDVANFTGHMTTMVVCLHCIYVTNKQLVIKRSTYRISEAACVSMWERVHAVHMHVLGPFQNKSPLSHHKCVTLQLTKPAL